MPLNIVFHNLLLRTGQTSTPQSGSDGTYQQGIPGTRFKDHSDGTVSDFHTSLMWVRTPHLLIPGADGLTANNEILSAEGVWSNGTDYVAGDLVQGDGDPDALFYICILANGPGGVGAQELSNATYWVVSPWVGSAANLTTAGEVNWSDAITNCEALDYAGFTDWRLPNAYELGSMFNFSASSAPATFAEFPNVAITDFYWNSDEYAFNPPYAWRERFSGSILSRWGALKTEISSVWPVRGGRFNA